MQTHCRLPSWCGALLIQTIAMVAVCVNTAQIGELAVQVSIIDATVRYVEQDFKLNEEVRCGCPPEDPNLLVPDDTRQDCSCDNPGAGFMHVEGNITFIVEPPNFSGYGSLATGTITDPNFHVCYDVRSHVCPQLSALSSQRRADDSGVCRILETMVKCIVQDLATFACRLPYSWL